MGVRVFSFILSVYMQLLSGQNLKNGKREEDEERVCVGKGGGTSGGKVKKKVCLKLPVLLALSI